MPTVELERVQYEAAPILENLLQLYCHDLSLAFDLSIGADGRFGYPSLSRYWREPARHFPFFIRVVHQVTGSPTAAQSPRSGHQVTGSPTAARSPRSGHQVTGSPTAAQSPRSGGELAGFVLATRGSPASADPEHLDVAEFFVLCKHRKHGVGRAAAQQLWDGLRGHWVVRAALKNESAVLFWRNTISAYAAGTQREFTLDQGGVVRQVFEFDA